MFSKRLLGKCALQAVWSMRLWLHANCRNYSFFPITLAFVVELLHLSNLQGFIFQGHFGCLFIALSNLFKMTYFNFQIALYQEHGRKYSQNKGTKCVKLDKMTTINSVARKSSCL